MARTPQVVTAAELQLLEALWDGPATIKQLKDRLYPGGGPAEYGTVQKLLDRLESKGFIARARTAPAHVFRAAVGREELIGRRLQDVAEQLCGGSLTPLLTHLVRGRQLSEEERQQLRDLIAELDGPEGDAGAKGKP